MQHRHHNCRTSTTALPTTWCSEVGHVARTTQTSWLQNIYCSTANYMMLWGGTCGQNQCHCGTSFMATWRSWGQLLSWRRQTPPSSVQQRRRTPENQTLICQYIEHSLLQMKPHVQAYTVNSSDNVKTKSVLTESFIVKISDVIFFISIQWSHIIFRQKENFMNTKHFLLYCSIQIFSYQSDLSCPVCHLTYIPEQAQTFQLCKSYTFVWSVWWHGSTHTQSFSLFKLNDIQ